MGCQDRGARLQLKAKKRHRKGANIISDHSHVAHVAAACCRVRQELIVPGLRSESESTATSKSASTHAIFESRPRIMIDLLCDKQRRQQQQQHGQLATGLGLRFGFLAHRICARH